MDASISAPPSATEEWRRLLELLPDATLVLVADGTIREANLPACRLFECDRTALVGTRFQTLATSSVAALDRCLADAWRSSAAIPGAATLRFGDGEVRCRLSAGVLSPRGSKAPALLVRVQAHGPSPFARLTEKVDALTSENASRRAAEARLQSTVDGLPVAICVRDGAGCFVLTNTTFRQWFGPVRAAPAGLRPADVLSPEVAAAVEADHGAEAPVERVLGAGDDARHLLVAQLRRGPARK